MTVVVSGGAGFIGTNLVARLLADGVRVVAIDNFLRGSRANLAGVLAHPAFHLIEADLADPMIPLLQHAGTTATFRLLTTGHVPAAALQGYAETLLRRRPELAAEPLIERFRSAGVSTTPYAYHVDPTGESVLALIEADPYRSTTAKPVLTEAEWTSLQSICAG